MREWLKRLDVKWFNLRQDVKWFVRRQFEKLTMHVHFAIYYRGETPGVKVPGGKWGMGLSEACWIFHCGYSLRFALHIGNIEWKLGDWLSHPKFCEGRSARNHPSTGSG